jgi:hypothetical protein
MFYSHLFLLAFVLVLPKSRGWWLFDDPPEISRVKMSKESDESREIVQFEALSAEDKFLAIAKEYLDLPALDRCQHKVMDELKKACNDISEEELAKLSVALLNCQSDSEGRPTYSCTVDMTIAECTAPMDPNTWNAYHIVSNRARSVCYATRQNQFRRRTEMAVNKLALATQEQISTMDKLKEDQETMQEAALASLDSVKTQQEELFHQHKHLKNAHRLLKTNIITNMDQLAKEKSIIAQSQDQLVEMTESVLEKLENATDQVKSQSEGSREQHQELLKDLGKLKEKAKQVWDKMDESISKLSSAQDQTATQYQRTLEDLKQINETINYILRVIDSLDYAINTQLSWLVGHIGGAASGLELVLVLGGHAAFLLLAAFILIFVQAPSLPRIVLLVLVVANTLSALQWQSSLDLLTLAVLLAAVTAGDWTVTKMRRKEPSLGMLKWTASTPIKTSENGEDCNVPLTPCGAVPLGPTTTDTPHSQHLLGTARNSCIPGLKDSFLGSELQDLVDDMTTDEYTSLKADLSSNQGETNWVPLPSKGKCQGVTKVGSKCRYNSLKGSPYCRRHANLS